MKKLPTTVVAYQKTEMFTAETVPRGLLTAHRTKEGVWGVINVTSGKLRYAITGTGEEIDLEPGTVGIIEPAIEHHVAPIGPVSFYVEFYR